MKNRYAKRRKLQQLLLQKTRCGIQYTGWPCNTCFHAMDLPITRNRLHSLWEATLKIRGDYPEIYIHDETLTSDIDELVGLLEK